MKKQQTGTNAQDIIRIYSQLPEQQKAPPFSTHAAEEADYNARHWLAAGDTPLKPGTVRDKSVVARMFRETFNAYKPSVIDWLKLDSETLLKMTSLPVWNIAVETEGKARLRMATYAATVSDPDMRDASARNAWEENRHKEVLSKLVEAYGIQLGKETPYVTPRDAEWAYMVTGFSEACRKFFRFCPVRACEAVWIFPLGTCRNLWTHYTGRRPRMIPNLARAIRFFLKSSNILFEKTQNARAARKRTTEISNCLNFRPLNKESNDSLNKNRILFLNLGENSDGNSASSEYITKIGKHCTNFRIDVVELNRIKCLFFPSKRQNIASKFIQGYDAFSIMISGNYRDDLEFIDFLNSQKLFLKKKPILFILHDNYISKKNSLLFLKQALDRSMNVVLPPPVLKGTELDQHSLINGWESLLEYLWESDYYPVVDELKSF